MEESAPQFTDGPPGSLAASVYNIFVPLRQGRQLAFNSASGALAVWEATDKSHFERLCQGADETGELARDMVRGGFLVDRGIDELDRLEERYQAHRLDQHGLMLTIAPTLACNFGCDYCFQGQDKPGETMSLEVQDAILAMVERSVPRLRHMGVAWYGGEPLLRLGVIESLSDRLIALCRRHGIQYSAMIVTNGYKLDLAAAKSLYQRGVTQAQVTLDGAPEYHDQRRTLLSGKPTFARIAANLRAVADAVPLALSIRVNIDARNHDQAYALIDTLAEQGLGGRKHVRMYFAPVEAITQGCHVVEDHCLTKSDYGRLETELYRYGHAKGLASLPYPSRFHGVCGAVRPHGFVITPTGDVHKCWDTVTWPRYAIGTVFDPDGLHRSEEARRWLRWTPFDNDTCRNCKILPNCAGACAYKFLHADQTRGEAAILPCPSWKHNLNERLLLMAEKQGAISPGDYDPHDVKTDPAQICREIHVDGGDALPGEIQALLAARKSAALFPILSA